MQMRSTMTSVAQRVSVWFAFHTLAKLIHTLARYGANNERRPAFSLARVLVICIALLAYSIPGHSQSATGFLFNDSHFHLTNYIQEGIDIHDFLKIMGNKAGRVALFGIPLAAAMVVSSRWRPCTNLLPELRRSALLLLIH